MFYKLNSLTGRVAPTTAAQAYSPQGLSPTLREAGEFVFDSSKTTAARVPDVQYPEAVAASAGHSSGGGGVVPRGSRYATIMEHQTKWSASHDLLVWQKRGGLDRMPFLLTMGTVGVAMALCVATLWKMSWPKKTEN